MGSSSRTGTESLVDHDTVGCGSRDEGGAVGEPSPPGVIVEADVGQAISDDTEKERHMPGYIVSNGLPDLLS